MKGIRAESSRELAVMINEFLTTKERRYTLRPFNRFDTERSLWWIVPSIDSPAYRFGKFFVEEVGGNFEVGLHIENGLTQTIERNRELIMDDTWVWHEFIEDVVNGNVGERLLRVQKGIGDNAGVIIRVEIPELIDAGDERGTRIIQLSNGQWWDEKQNAFVDLESIADWVGSIDGIGWHWIDVFVTYTLEKYNDSQQGEWSAFDIVHNLLEPLEDWVR